MEESKKGIDGGSAGRNGKSFVLAERCREMTPEALARLEEVLLTGRGSEVIKAAEVIIAYGWGKAPQTVELHHHGGVDVNLFDPAKRREIVNAVLDRIRHKGTGD